MPNESSPESLFCPFCVPEPGRVFHEDGLVVGVWDGFAVSPGHALLVPKRHVETWFDASAGTTWAAAGAIIHRPTGNRGTGSVRDAFVPSLSHGHLMARANGRHHAGFTLVELVSSPTGMPRSLTSRTREAREPTRTGGCGISLPDGYTASCEACRIRAHP